MFTQKVFYQNAISEVPSVSLQEKRRYVRQRLLEIILLIQRQCRLNPTFLNKTPEGMLIIYWDKFKLFLLSCCTHPHPSFIFVFHCPLQVLQVTSVVLLLVCLTFG